MSEMFKAAHTGAKADIEFLQYAGSRMPYAYFFRLHLLNLQREAKVKRTGMGFGFQMHEGRVWA